jgi:hypothetical protein
MRWWPILKCPFCRGVLPNEELWLNKPLTCPSCSRQLQIAEWYIKLNGVIALALSVILCLLLGYRGGRLFVSTVLFWFLVRLVWAFISARIFNTPFEPYVPKEAIKLGIDKLKIVPKDDERKKH